MPKNSPPLLAPPCSALDPVGGMILNGVLQLYVSFVTFPAYTLVINLRAANTLEKAVKVRA